MSTLKLSGTDLDVTNGHWSLIDGRPQVAQAIGIALRFQRGEWFADKRVGTPLIERIFSPRADIGIINSTLKNAIESRDGVIACRSLNSSLSTNGTARRLDVTFVASTETGEIIQGQERLIFSVDPNEDG